MKSHHRISDSLFDFIYRAVSTHHFWIAYKSKPFFLRDGDLHCFRTRDEASYFKQQGNAEGEGYALIYAPSVLSVYRQIERQSLATIFSSSNTKTMNEQNFNYLADSLKYLGFGDALSEKLKTEMQKGEPSFQLAFETEINKKAFAAVINFRKSDTTDHYFVNSYHATLQRSNGEIYDQAFYLNKGKGVTAKEAYNLLEGRAVYKELENKEGQKYGAWIQLDFEQRDKNNNHEVRQYHDNYGYDLKSTLGRFNIREMQAPDLADVLMHSLMKGNLQAVVMEKDGGAVRLFVEAAPQYKSVNLYDTELKRIPKKALDQYMSAGVVREQQGLSTGIESKEKKNGKEVHKDDEPAKGKGQIKTKEKETKDPKELMPKKENGPNKKSVKLG